MRFLLTAAALALLTVPAFGAERPPVFPAPPAFPACEAPACTCSPCACDPCDCLARAAVLLTVGVVGDSSPTVEQRITTLERELTLLRLRVEARDSRRGAAPPSFPAGDGFTTEEVTTPDGGRKVVRVDRGGSSSGGRYVTRQVCSGGSCQLVQEWAPDAPAVVQAAGRTYGDHFIDTDQQPGGGSAPAVGGGCSGGSCGGPVLRIRGGPGLFRR